MRSLSYLLFIFAFATWCTAASSHKANTNTHTSATGTSKDQSTAVSTNKPLASTAGSSTKVDSSTSSKPSQTKSATSKSPTATSKTKSPTSTASPGHSSSTPTPTPGSNANTQTAKYVVYPKNRDDQNQVQGIQNQLTKFTPLKNIFSSTFSGQGTAFWILQMSADQAKQMKTFTGVSNVYATCTKDCPGPDESVIDWQRRSAVDDYDVAQGANDSMSDLHQLQKRGIKAQNTNDRNLAHVSWAKGQDIMANDPGEIYRYDESFAGQNVVTYILDRGADLDQDEFGVVKSLIVDSDWIYADPSTTNTKGDDPGGHGTCMLSKVTGWSYGISKQVQPKIVRLPPDSQNPPPEMWLHGVRASIDHWKTKARGKNGVEDVAVFLQAQNHKSMAGITITQEFIDGYRTALTDAVKEGMLPVTGSGNDNNKPIDGYPARFTDQEMPNMLVTGGVTFIGSQSPRSQVSAVGSSVDVYAPGQNVKCARPDGVISGGTGGTSPASAAAAGLAAYYMSQGGPTVDRNWKTLSLTDKVGALKRRVVSTAWKKTNPNDGTEFPYPSIWNGIDSRNQPSQ